MKTRIYRIAFMLLMVAVLVAGGVYPTTSQAAAKGTTYNVTLENGSMTASLVSIQGGTPAMNTAKAVGTTFQLVVGTKLLTDKKTGATYYEVVIPKKSYRGVTQEFPMPGGGIAVKGDAMKGDAKGKLYADGKGDVDVTNVLGKKMVSKIGDGTPDPAGSMIIQISTQIYLKEKASGKSMMNLVTTSWYTTGKTTIVGQGSKTKLDGKTLPDGDTSNTLPKPLIGKPIDLKAGTGTLVVCSGYTKLKSKLTGITDALTGQNWILNIK